MKLNHVYFLIVLSAGMAVSCDENELVPTEQPLIPLLLEELNYSKEFVHDADGRLSEIKMVSTYPNGVKDQSVQSFAYESGRLKESATDTGWKMVYTFTGDVITRTDEYVNGQHSQYHTYQYDASKRLISTTTYQNIPEEGGEIPVASSTFDYDTRGNVTFYRLFYHGTRGEGTFPLTTFAYSDYDDKINSEDYFDLNPFNPLMRLSKNNPGKMIVANAKGVVSSTELYTYEYHPKGYATKKTTHATLYNGNTGTYTSTFKFKE
ncbi:MAG: hypothetical protein ACOYW3_07395 [Bacteroidota bacterium]